MKNPSPAPIDLFALLDPKNSTPVTLGKLGKLGALSNAERRHCARVARAFLKSRMRK